MKHLLAISLTLPLVASQAYGVTVLGTFGEAIDAKQATTVTASETPFDINGGSTLVVTLAAESAGFPGGSTPPGASAERVFFGRQPMTFAGATVNGGINPTTQITEIWYLHNPWDQAATFRIEWDPGNGSGVSGTGFGALSLNNTVQSAPTFFGNDLGLSVDLTGVTSGSTVVATAVANDSSNDVLPDIAGLTELYGFPDFEGNRTGGVGSARAGAGFAENVSGDFTAEFMFGLTGATPNRPASSAAAFADGPFMSPTLAPVPGDTNGDRVLDVIDYNNIRANLGATGFELGTITPDVTGFDGVVSLEDLAFFLSVYPGPPSALAASSTVPEPSAFGLALIVAAMIGFRTRACAQ